MKRSYIILVVIAIVLLHELHGKNRSDKLKNHKSVKSQEDKTKSVSSDKVPNNGNKGPLSSGSKFPLFPIIMTPPLIPHQKKSKKQSTRKKKKSGNNSTETEFNNGYVDIKKHKNKKKQLTKHALASKNKHGSSELKSNKNHTLSDEEEAMKRSWVSSDDYLPNSFGSSLYEGNVAMRKFWRNFIDDKVPSVDGEEFSEDEKQMLRAWLSMESELIPAEDGVSEVDDEDINAIPGHESVSINHAIENSEGISNDEDVSLTDEEEEIKNNWIDTNAEKVPAHEGVSLTDEEEQMKREWLAMDSESIPGKESVYFRSELDSLFHDTANAFDLNARFIRKRSAEENLMILNDEERDRRLDKRDTIDEDDLMILNAEETEDRHMSVRDLMDDDDDNLSHYIETRGSDEKPDTVEEAEQKLRNAAQAAEQLTALEKKLGIDPENLAGDTRRHIAELEEKKAKLDEDIRKHIEMTNIIEKRASIAGEYKTADSEVNSSKRQLEEDHSKIEEINTELKQLKDVELMATGLEVAKYLAQERAKHNLEVAKAAVRSSVKPEKTTPAPSPPPIVSNPPAQNINQNMALPSGPLAPQFYSQQLPIGSTSFIPLPSFFKTSPNLHQVADQRRIDNKSSKQTLTDYLSDYIQTKTAQVSNFQNPNITPNKNVSPSTNTASNINVSPSTNSFSNSNFQNQNFQQNFNPPPVPNRPFFPQLSYSQGNQNLLPDNRPGSQPMLQQNPNNQQQQQYMLQKQPMIQGFASAPARNIQMQQTSSSEFHTNGDIRHLPARPKENVGKADHTHKEEDKSDDKDDNDWGALSFPGTTYSPPPTWLNNLHPGGVMQPQRIVTQQAQLFRPPNIWQARPEIPYVRPEVHPAITVQRPVESAASIPGLELQAPQGSYKASTPSIASFQEPINGQQFLQQSNIFGMANAAYKSNNPPIAAPISNQPQQTVNQISANMFPEKSFTENRPGAFSIINSYANNNQQHQTSPQRVSTGQVLNLSPQDETYTINPPAPAPQVAPQKAPAPLRVNYPSSLGMLDVNIYPDMWVNRAKTKQPPVPPNYTIHDTANFNKAQTTDSPIKREYQKLEEMNERYQNAVKASQALTHIESAIGFDPGSIAKMVDFVKTAALKDVELSKDTIEKDKETLQKIQGETKKSTIAKKSDINNNIALDHAEQKLKADNAVLTDAEDRLDKIKKMEMIVTEVEVAKFIAVESAENSVKSENLKIESLKRDHVANP